MYNDLVLDVPEEDGYFRAEDVDDREQVVEGEVGEEDEDGPVEVHDPGLVEVLLEEHQTKDQRHHLNKSASGTFISILPIIY